MAGAAQKATVTGMPGSDVEKVRKSFDLAVLDLETLRAASAGALLTGTATYDPASLVDGAGATTTITVTGAVLGDYVQGISFSLDLQGILLTAYVSAADTVAVRFQNETTGTIDLASGTLRALVRSFAVTPAVAAASLLAYVVQDNNGNTT